MHSFILEAIALGGYVGLFILMALENVFPPLPSEIIMGYSGLLVAQGRMNFWAVLLIGTAGTVAGNLFWYWLGRRWKEPHLRAFITRHGRWLTMDWPHFEKARASFRRNGEWIVFVLRMSPFLRTLISLPAGLARMSLSRFMVFTFLGSLVWNGVLIAGGSALAPMVARYEGVASWVVGGTVVVAILAYAWRVWRWNPGAATSD